MQGTISSAQGTAGKEDSAKVSPQNFAIHTYIDSNVCSSIAV